MSGLVSCLLAVKDSDLCLANSGGEWNEKSTCAENDDKCEEYKKDMYRCCPNTCPSDTPFGQSDCENVDSTKKGKCTYPFKTTAYECYNKGNFH